MLLGLLNIIKREGHDADVLVYSYYPRRDVEIAASLPGVKVRKGHPRDLALFIPLLLLNRLLGFALLRFLRTSYAAIRSVRTLRISPARPDESASRIMSGHNCLQTAQYPPR